MRPEKNTRNWIGLKTIPLEDVKIGVLYIGSASDTSGYTYAHELGIQGMVSNLGLKEDLQFFPFPVSNLRNCSEFHNLVKFILFIEFAVRVTDLRCK